MGQYRFDADTKIFNKNIESTDMAKRWVNNVVGFVDAATVVIIVDYVHLQFYFRIGLMVNN